VGFVVDRVVLGQIFLAHFGFLLPVIISLILHTGAGTIDTFEAAVSSYSVS
jgi:hypothetical protein